MGHADCSRIHKGFVFSRIITQDHGVSLSFVDNIIYSVSSKWNKLTFLEYAQNDFISFSMYAGSSQILPDGHL